MTDPVYVVNAQWDDEAAVWVATSDDIPGLATEAETMELLLEKLNVMIPELLAANDALPEQNHPAIPFQLMSVRRAIAYG